MPEALAARISRSILCKGRLTCNIPRCAPWMPGDNPSPLGDVAENPRAIFCPDSLPRNLSFGQIHRNDGHIWNYKYIKLFYLSKLLLYLRHLHYRDFSENCVFGTQNHEIDLDLATHQLSPFDQKCVPNWPTTGLIAVFSSLQPSNGQGLSLGSTRVFQIWAPVGGCANWHQRREWRRPGSASVRDDPHGYVPLPGPSCQSVPDPRGFASGSDRGDSETRNRSGYPDGY